MEKPDNIPTIKVCDVVEAESFSLACIAQNVFVRLVTNERVQLKDIKPQKIWRKNKDGEYRVIWRAKNG